MSKQKPQTSFAKDFQELESIVHSFEKNRLDIDDSIEQFERGLQIAERLKKTLETAENRIVTLKKKYRVDEADS